MFARRCSRRFWSILRWLMTLNWWTCSWLGLILPLGGRGAELSASQQCFAAGKYLPMSGFKWPESSLKSRPAVDSEPGKAKSYGHGCGFGYGLGHKHACRLRGPWLLDIFQVTGAFVVRIRFAFHTPHKKTPSHFIEHKSPGTLAFGLFVRPLCPFGCKIYFICPTTRPRIVGMTLTVLWQS